MLTTPPPQFVKAVTKEQVEVYGARVKSLLEHETSPS